MSKDYDPQWVAAYYDEYGEKEWDDLPALMDKGSPQWQELLRMELEACCQDGSLDLGTHIIAVGEKR